MGKGGHKETVAKIIDNLIDSGYLRTEKKQDGEIEIKRWND
jgi:predicted HTH transcriptional regulator